MKRERVKNGITVLKYTDCSTVIGSQSGSLHSKWISQYLRHFSTEMAEIWSPGTFFEDVWTHKKSMGCVHISARACASNVQSEPIAYQMHQLHFMCTIVIIRAAQ